LNPKPPIPDNGVERAAPNRRGGGAPDAASDQMKDMRESTRARSLQGEWWRRAVISLWVAIFLVGGGALAANWDTLMARLARPPLSAAASR